MQDTQFIKQRLLEKKDLLVVHLFLHLKNTEKTVIFYTALGFLVQHSDLFNYILSKTITL